MLKSLFILILSVLIAPTCYGQTEEDWLKRGESHLKSKDYRAAIDDYSKAIEIDPKLTYAYRDRGICKFYLDDYNGALADLNTAVELMPKYARAYYDRGAVKNGLKDYSGAIADFSKAIELEPEPYAFL